MELEPERRRALLEELTLTEPDDGANAYRLKLFSIRHVDEKDPGKYVDRLLFQCVNFIQLYKSARFFKKSAGKEVAGVCSSFLFDEASRIGEAGERALYWELRNAASRYFKTCQSDSYGRSLFGFMRASDLGRSDRMCKDAWEMSEGLAGRVGEEKRLAIWNEAVRDSYFMTDTSASRHWEDYRQKMMKK